MASILQTSLGLVEPIGIAFVLVFLYGVSHRKSDSVYLTQAWMGLAFGVAAAFGMAAPIVISSGLIVDLRNLFIGIAAAFFGWRGMAIALGVSVLMRLGIGGAGAASGVVGMTIAAAMGLTWAAFVKPVLGARAKGYAALAAMISLHLCALMVLPGAMAWTLLLDYAPQIVVLNFLGTFLLAYLIQREQALFNETQTLLSEATTDPLTKALNRRSAITSYEELIDATFMPRGLAMVCIDVDNFKSINDTEGHLAGDRVLIEITKRIRSCLRTGDIFARMSGDEFLIVLNNVTSEQSLNISERCRKTVACAPIGHGDVKINTTISLGTVWTAQPKDFGTMRDAADAALYQAKAQGRNRSAFVQSSSRGIRERSSTVKVA